MVNKFFEKATFHAEIRYLWLTNMKYWLKSLGTNDFETDISLLAHWLQIVGFLKSMKYQYASMKKALIRADQRI